VTFRMWLAGLLGFFATISASAEELTSKQNDWQATGKKGAIVAGHRQAVQAGVSVMTGGGNAADTAVTTILALSVRLRELLLWRRSADPRVRR
jgi:hypothetical protein